ncbi:MAG: pyridoxamine 5'-phosphate oxidase family protein [Spirochaetales bacterium]|uniref:Pyridoxamine 5'-phosphate oxidase family protein n=1 Tax=Candidatus Thalassospirochaeta sargassi TaxID=3119039 RepID=A0AAJ1MIK4_9SPIO|nr:pyridoxamine 5'-phosphate oxidase family protein [Spirochaetales bacterium]
MPKLPENVKADWEKRAGAVVFSTVDPDGTPNSIYATCVGLFEDRAVVVANNYFDKTMKNIKNGSKASVVFITDEKKAYQVKGSIEYHDNGPVFDFMKSWNPEQHPGHGAAEIKIEAVYSGSEKLV